MDDLTQDSIFQTARQAVAEDVGDGDITALLIPTGSQAQASLLSREEAVIAGQPWFNAVFRFIDPGIEVSWQVNEGASVSANTELMRCTGSARSILTAERTAMNFLQTLSGTATATHALAQSIQHTKAKLLDTRKTLPGLRYAQKYAVRLGGGENHRIGLFDAFLIKENHILAAGGIDAAIQRARAHAPEKRLEIEVETLAELETAIAAQPDWIMLDNFTLDGLRAAVSITPSSIKLEASGGIEGQKTLIDIAETGVDYISVGALTKHCKAIDLSLRFAELPC
jgi:nicotinate-nucleotide pyrophosphorylase (carboxylating)